MASIMTWGISFGSAIRSLSNLDEALSKDFSLVELPAREQAFLDPIVHILRAHSISISLHLPSPEIAKLHPFIFDTRTVEEVTEYIKLLETFFALPYKLKYIVVHYPLITKSISTSDAKGLNDLFLTGLCRLRRRYNRRLFLENIAGHAVLGNAEHFQKALLQTDGFCLDLGHAHTFNLLHPKASSNQLKKQFEINGDTIRAVHLYNATVYNSDRYNTKTHYPFTRDISANLGFMAYDEVVSSLRVLPHLEYIILEPDRQEYLNHGCFGAEEWRREKYE